MDGRDFVELLLEELDCKNDNQLAKRLAVKAPNVNYWRRSALTKTIVRNVLGKLIRNAVRTSFTPIVEFRRLDQFHGHAKDTLAKRINSKELTEVLSKSKGVYFFYDSSCKVIYSGKTVDRYLLGEMKQAFDQTRPQYKRKLINKGGAFTTKKMSIRDTAHYFSAYQVADPLISNLEAFVTRIIPNNLINRRTERFR